MYVQKMIYFFCVNQTYEDFVRSAEAQMDLFGEGMLGISKTEHPSNEMKKEKEIF